MLVRKSLDEIAASAPKGGKATRLAIADAEIKEQIEGDPDTAPDISGADLTARAPICG